MAKLSHPYPLPPPLPDSHLAHHSGTPPSSLSRTDSKGPTQGKKKWLSTSLPWESSVGLPLSCHYATTAVTCFSPFPSSHPLCYSPTSPTALTFPFFSNHLCPTLGTASWNVQPSNGDTVLECLMPFRFVTLSLWLRACSEITTLRCSQDRWHNVSWLCRHTHSSL